MRILTKIEVALIAFTDSTGRIMLNRRADADSEMWELVGGGVEAGEIPEAAIRREIKEELHYTLGESDSLTMVDSFIYKSHKFSAKVYCFTAKYPGKDQFKDSEETQVNDLEMFSIENASKLPLLPMTKIFLERMK